MEQKENRLMQDYFFPLHRMIVFRNEYDAKMGMGRSMTCIARNGRSNAQPKCRLEVCMKMCPYRDKALVADIVGLDGNHDAVTLGRVDAWGRTGGDWYACMVMYLNRKCSLDEVDGCEVDFAKSHSPRLLDDCPLKMEHELYGWNRK